MNARVALEVSMAVAEEKSTKTSVTFQHILVATDFSEASRRALCDALALAAENHAQVSVVHGLQHDRQYAGPEQHVATTLVANGPVAEAVERVIEEGTVDLLVIGTRGRGGLQKLALGS